MTYTVAVYVRGRFIGWKDVQSAVVPEPIDAETYKPDPIGQRWDVDLWKFANRVRATVGSKPVRLVLAEDK